MTFIHTTALKPSTHAPKKWFLAARIGLAALTAPPLAGCRPHPADTPATPQTANVDGARISMPEHSPQRDQLTTETVAQAGATSVQITGRLVWNDDVTARVFSPLTGWIASVSAEVGGQVSQGDVLVLLKSPDYGQAQSDSVKAASDLALADRTLARERELFEHGAAAKKDVESAEADYEKAVAEHQRVTAQLLALSGGTTNTVDGLFRLRSPVAGTVVEKNTSPGQLVRPDQMLANAPAFVAPLMIVSDPTRLWLWLDVSEMELPKFKPGMPLKIHSKAFPDKVFDGVVDSVGDSLDPLTRTVKVRGTVNNPERLLKAEMFVTADAPDQVAATGAVDVSSRAVFLMSNRHYLFVEEAPGTFERREVKVGTEANGRTRILDGVHCGLKVVSEGCLLLNALMESGV